MLPILEMSIVSILSRPRAHVVWLGLSYIYIYMCVCVCVKINAFKMVKL